MTRGRVALALVALLAVNGAYALTLPEVLSAFTPATPLGLREGTSPIVDAGATFVLVEDSGVEFRRYQWSDGDLPYPAVITGGIAAGDVDGDGRIDLYFPPGGPAHPAALYRNLGAWKFADVTRDAGLEAEGFGAGTSFADFDNDGDADLYVVIGDGGRLYRNDGSGRFEDVSERAGVSLDGACGARPCQGTSVAWLDADADGWLDLYVVNNLDWRAPGLHTSGEAYASLIYFAPRQSAVLYRNLGDGTFADVTLESGVENTGKGLGVATSDFDGDGRLDIATANDITENALYLHRGSAFENVARRAGVSEVKSSMGIAAGDVDGDGRSDLVVSNFRGHKLSLLVQGDDGSFSYDTETRGLGASSRGTGWGVALFDYDLDGWLDVAHAVGRAVPLAPHENDLQNLLFPELREDAEDQLYRNLGHGAFGEATASAGAFAGLTNTRALLAVDLDGDGDEDVVRVNLQGEPAELLRNDVRAPGASLQLTLQGTSSNRDGIGARIEATLPDGRVLVRERVASAGYQTGLSPVVTIGLGQASAARVVVTWPSGVVQDLGEVDAGAHRIVEP